MRLSATIQSNISPNRAVALCVGTLPVQTKIDGEKYINPIKSWPYEYWIELGNKLVNKGHQVLFLGSKKEAQDLCNYADKINQKIINMCGKYSIAQTMAIINNVSIVVGADTGLMHCGGALGKKCITLFGPTAPQQYLAYGSNSYYISANVECSPCFGSEKAAKCKAYKCMKSIAVEAVLNKIQELV